MDTEIKQQISSEKIQKTSNNRENFEYLIQKKEQQIFYGQQDSKIRQSQGKINTTNSLNNRSEEFSQQKQEKHQFKQVRSAFHNFQKHLVITLRKVVKVKKSTNKKQCPVVASELWQNFTKQTKIYTKNILHIIFGVVDFECSQLINIYDEQVIERFGFSQIFSKYSDPLINEAQQYLRNEVVKQLSQVDLNQIMKKRRLSSTEGFVEYVKQFISELQQGPIRKRLPKNKKIAMALACKNQQ